MDSLSEKECDIIDKFNHVTAALNLQDKIDRISNFKECTPNILLSVIQQLLDTNFVGDDTKSKLQNALAFLETIIGMPLDHLQTDALEQGDTLTVYQLLELIVDLSHVILYQNMKSSPLFGKPNKGQQTRAAGSSCGFSSSFIARSTPPASPTLSISPSAPSSHHLPAQNITSNRSDNESKHTIKKTDYCGVTYKHSHSDKTSIPVLEESMSPTTVPLESSTARRKDKRARSSKTSKSKHSESACPSKLSSSMRNRTHHFRSNPSISAPPPRNKKEEQLQSRRAATSRTNSTPTVKESPVGKAEKSAKIRSSAKKKTNPSGKSSGINYASQKKPSPKCLERSAIKNQGSEHQKKPHVTKHNDSVHKSQHCTEQLNQQQPFDRIIGSNQNTKTAITGSNEINALIRDGNLFSQRRKGNASKDEPNGRLFCKSQSQPNSTQPKRQAVTSMHIPGSKKIASVICQDVNDLQASVQQVKTLQASNDVMREYDKPNILTNNDKYEVHNSLCNDLNYSNRNNHPLSSRPDLSLLYELLQQDPSSFNTTLDESQISTAKPISYEDIILKNSSQPQDTGTRLPCNRDHSNGTQTSDDFDDKCACLPSKHDSFLHLGSVDKRNAGKKESEEPSSHILSRDHTDTNFVRSQVLKRVLHMCRNRGKAIPQVTSSVQPGHIFDPQGTSMDGKISTAYQLSPQEQNHSDRKPGIKYKQAIKKSSKTTCHTNRKARKESKNENIVASSTRQSRNVPSNLISPRKSKGKGFKYGETVVSHKREGNQGDGTSVNGRNRDKSSKSLTSRLSKTLPAAGIDSDTKKQIWEAEMKALRALLSRNQLIKSAPLEVEEQCERYMRYLDRHIAAKKRLDSHKFERNLRLQAQRRIRDKRYDRVQQRQAYEKFHLRRRALGLKESDKTQHVVHNALEKTLTRFKQSIRELEAYRKELQQQQQEQEKQEIDILTDHYRQQVKLLDDALRAREEQENELSRMHTIEKAKARRKLRAHMKHDVERLLQNIFRDEDIAFYREIDANMA